MLWYVNTFAKFLFDLVFVYGFGIFIYACLISLLLQVSFVYYATLAVIIFGYYFIKKHILNKSKFNSSTTADQALDGKDLSNKFVIITGCNQGIGYETMKTLFKANANIIMGCRDIKKAENAKFSVYQDLKINIDNNNRKNFIDIIELDLKSFKSIFNFIDVFKSKYESLNYLVNNAGIFGPQKYTENEHGIESVFMTNVLGPFILMVELIPSLLKGYELSKEYSRVINVSSDAHLRIFRWFYHMRNFFMDSLSNKNDYNEQLKVNYGRMFAYSISKASLILLSRAFNRYYYQDGIMCVSLHPGTAIKTNIVYGNMTSWQEKIFELLTIIFPRKSLSQGCATTIRCIVMNNENEINKGGGYYVDCQLNNNKLSYDCQETLKNLNDNPNTFNELLLTKWCYKLVHQKYKDRQLSVSFFDITGIQFE